MFSSTSNVAPVAPAVDAVQDTLTGTLCGVVELNDGSVLGTKTDWTGAVAIAGAVNWKTVVRQSPSDVAVSSLAQTESEAAGSAATPTKSPQREAIVIGSKAPTTDAVITAIAVPSPVTPIPGVQRSAPPTEWLKSLFSVGTLVVTFSCVTRATSTPPDA